MAVTRFSKEKEAIKWFGPGVYVWEPAPQHWRKLRRDEKDGRAANSANSPGKCKYFDFNNTDAGAFGGQPPVQKQRQQCSIQYCKKMH